jgi:mycofactocin precursor
VKGDDVKTNVQGEAIEQEKVGQDPGRDERLDRAAEEPRIVDDICVEELAIDGICGVY